MMSSCLSLRPRLAFMCILATCSASAADTPSHTEKAAIQTPTERQVGGIDLVRISGGCFDMGSPFGERGRDDDEQQQRVCVEDFWLGKLEITNAQFRAFRPQHDSRSFRQYTLNDPRQPVVRVSYADAMDYLRWLSERAGQRLRLPTEAEWEYAARAGDDSARYWTDASGDACEYANMADQSLAPLFYNQPLDACDDGFPLTTPVGYFKPNAFGLHDMLGNVWELTCSRYAVSYAGEQLRCAEAPGPQTRLSNRGGAWSSVNYRLRAAARTASRADYKNRDLGFRVAMDDEN
jgi:formylglycine-generating enzyme required for sulfatase activity